MGFEIFIAKRYLRSKRKIQFVSIISLISIVGVTVGVAALLIVLSVFNGFTSIVTSFLISFDPHIRIEKRGGLDADDYRQVQTLVDSDTRVMGYSPFVQGKGMLLSRSFSKVVYVCGVDEEKIGKSSGVAEKIVLGEFLLRDTIGREGMVIGLALADRLAALVGDEISVLSPHALTAALSPFTPVSTEKFVITGIFESNNKEYDANYAYISLDAAQRLFKMENQFSGIEMRMVNLGNVERVKAELESRLSRDIQVSTWYDLHKDLYSVMQIERWVAYIILCLIIVVASFNMLGSLTMSVIEKRRDIGVLRSMGVTRRSLIRIFMFEGIIVGVVGTLLGILLGLLLLYLQLEYHLFPLDTSVYIIPAIPVEIQWIDFVAVSFASLMLSVFASYYPARRAAKIIPVEALRWE